MRIKSRSGSPVPAKTHTPMIASNTLFSNTEKSSKEAAHRRMLTEFSRAHLPNEVVRSPQKVARYIAQTFDLGDVISMAEDALLAAWRLRGKRFHYTRTAGRFAEWRAAQARPTSASSPSTRSLNVRSRIICRSTLSTL